MTELHQGTVALVKELTQVHVEVKSNTEGKLTVLTSSAESECVRLCVTGPEFKDRWIDGPYAIVSNRDRLAWAEKKRQAGLPPEDTSEEKK